MWVCLCKHIVFSFNFLIQQWKDLCDGLCTWSSLSLSLSLSFSFPHPPIFRSLTLHRPFKDLDSFDFFCAWIHFFGGKRQKFKFLSKSSKASKTWRWKEITSKCSNSPFQETCLDTLWVAIFYDLYPKSKFVLKKNNWYWKTFEFTVDRVAQILCVFLYRFKSFCPLTGQLDESVFGCIFDAIFRVFVA